MAVPKRARVLAAEMVGPDTRVLELLCSEPLGFVGGQYVIVDSGLVQDNGKAVKRAYSVLTGDAQQARFQIAVKRIPGGPGSAFVHGLDAGADLRFSGPWGKFFPQNCASGPTLVLATDTGITAALGLVQSSRLEPLLPRWVLIWLRTEPGYFLSDPFVRERVPASCGEVRIERLPPIGHPERIRCARGVLAEVLGRLRLEQGFLSGDGAVNYALLADLVTAGVTATRDNVESFFNMPKRSS